MTYRPFHLAEENDPKAKGRGQLASPQTHQINYLREKARLPTLGELPSNAPNPFRFVCFGFQKVVVGTECILLCFVLLLQFSLALAFHLNAIKGLRLRRHIQSPVDCKCPSLCSR